MTGQAAPAADPLGGRGADPSVAKFKDLHTSSFRKEAPHVPGVLPATDRVRDFAAVEAGLTDEDARYEAARCFKCGTCVECDTCLRYCPDFAIRRKEGGFYEIDLAHCKGCGVCVEECPRDAIHLRKST
jgi:2-oxoacid:acceptor oxidoreductase delta subunit (pyruvate/2-ketoisovalerate family)